MKIQVFSDLHTEFGKQVMPLATDADVIVDAGDHHPGVLGLMELREWFPDKTLVTVAGNHEFYGKRRLHRHYEKMKDKADELDIHFLQNDSVVIDGVKFIGATLWTDMNYQRDGGLTMLRAGQAMNDYRQIRSDISRLLTPHDTLMEHTLSLEYIKEELTKYHKGPRVVVTHHAPSHKSCEGKFFGHPLNAAYASDLHSIMSGYSAPNLWIHGHVHTTNDYVIGRTRVVSNPKGYELGKLERGGKGPIQENWDFNPQFVVEV